MHKLEHIDESINKENPAVTIICGDYNAKSTLFWKNDITNLEGCIFRDYKRKVWNYRAAKVYLIRDQLDNVNWNDLFHNLNVNEMCILFTDVFLGVMSINISNKTITCNDKDAPWITTSLKTAIERNSRVYRKWVQRGRNPTEHQNACDVQNSTNKFIKQAKQTYFTSLGKKLSDPNTGQKSFWTVYKRIINSKKQTNIPPLIENDVFISNFLQKADVLNDCLASQCTIEWEYFTHTNIEDR